MYLRTFFLAVVLMLGCVVTASASDESPSAQAQQLIVQHRALAKALQASAACMEAGESIVVCEVDLQEGVDQWRLDQWQALTAVAASETMARWVEFQRVAPAEKKGWLHAELKKSIAHLKQAIDDNAWSETLSGLTLQVEAWSDLLAQERP